MAIRYNIMYMCVFIYWRELWKIKKDTLLYRTKTQAKTTCILSQLTDGVAISVQPRDPQQNKIYYDPPNKGQILYT